MRNPGDLELGVAEDRLEAALDLRHLILDRVAVVLESSSVSHADPALGINLALQGPDSLLHGSHAATSTRSPMALCVSNRTKPATPSQKIAKRRFDKATIIDKGLRGGRRGQN